MAKKCTRKKITIKKKGGKIIATFMGHTGSDCPKRKKPSTARLKPWKDVMKVASPQCARKFAPFTKPFGRCMKDALRSVRG